jgi:hypothetical protein
MLVLGGHKYSFPLKKSESADVYNNVEKTNSTNTILKLEKVYYCEPPTKFSPPY